MKTSELIRFLSRNGCELERHGGRHDKWVNRKTGVSEWIPRHAAEVPKGLAEKNHEEVGWGVIPGHFSDFSI